ncbi:MAG: hypothetical protein H0W62_12215 [Chitinophagales bacterium]|nr:hypothetical protein [Chitinophagales bacterium]
MNRLFIYVLGSIVMASSVFATYGLLFNIKQQTINHRSVISNQADQLKHTDLIVITLQQYNLLPKSINGKLKEVNWNGNRYDILDIHIKNGNVYLACFNDITEKRLLDSASSIANDFGNPESAKNFPCNLKIKIPDFFFEKGTSALSTPINAIAINALPLQQFTQGNFNFYHSPPPKV